MLLELFIGIDVYLFLKIERSDGSLFVFLYFNKGKYKEECIKKNFK